MNNSWASFVCDATQMIIKNHKWVINIFGRKFLDNNFKSITFVVFYQIPLKDLRH